jgi:hypothetical protein
MKTIDQLVVPSTMNPYFYRQDLTETVLEKQSRTRFPCYGNRAVLKDIKFLVKA